MIKKKKYYGAILLALLLGVCTLPAPLSAVTAEGTVNSPDDSAGVGETPAEPDVDVDDEISAFNNPAQAQRAANLAEQAAINNDSVKEALQNVEDAQKALDEALTVSPDNAKAIDADAIAAARETLAKAEEAYSKELADITGVTETDIASMRDLDMGWGQICHELGLHPSANGLGRFKEKHQYQAGIVAEPTISGVNPQELVEATARNMQSGWSKGHGVGVRSGVHDAGTGLFDGAISSGRGRGHNKDRGVSGAGGLGHGGGPDGSMDGSGVDGGRGNSGGNKGGNTSSSGGPGNSGGHSNSGGQDKAGKDGSPGKSGSNGNSGDQGKSGSSHGKSGESHGNSGGKTT